MIRRLIATSCTCTCKLIGTLQEYLGIFTHAGIYMYKDPGNWAGLDSEYYMIGGGAKLNCTQNTKGMKCFEVQSH